MLMLMQSTLQAERRTVSLVKRINEADVLEIGKGSKLQGGEAATLIPSKMATTLSTPSLAYATYLRQFFMLRRAKKASTKRTVTQ
jgi:hypothetical protein